MRTRTPENDTRSRNALLRVSDKLEERASPSQGPSGHRERSGVHVSLFGLLCWLRRICVLLASSEPGDLAAGALRRMGSRGGTGLGAGTAVGAPRHWSPPVPSGSLFSVNHLPPGVGLEVRGRGRCRDRGSGAPSVPTRCHRSVRGRPVPSLSSLRRPCRPASGVSVSRSHGTCAPGAEGTSAFPRPGGLCRVRVGTAAICGASRGPRRMALFILGATL